MTNEWCGERLNWDDSCVELPGALQAIVGKTVSKASMREGVLVLALSGGGAWMLVPEGECCSTSYWQESEFEGLENLVDSPVLRVVNRFECVEKDEGDYQETKVYALELVTAKGSAVFEMRNESNGYYGGTYSAEWAAL
jgi:hypothetical protein